MSDKELAIASVGDDLSVSMQTLETDILAINAQIDVAKKTCADLAVDEATLEEMPYKDVKNLEQALSKTISNAEDARKQLKKHWNEPLNIVTAKYNDAMGEVKRLHEQYKQERVGRDEAEKENKRADLEATYLDFIESSGLENLADLLPFDRILEDRWLNKSCKKEKADNELVQKVSAIVADWESLKKTQYHYPEEAQAEFFRTLSLREVNENDARKFEEAQKLEALNKEVSENQAYGQAPEPIYDPIIEEAESIVADVEPIRTYIIEAHMTESQWAMVRGYLQQLGIHGSLKQVVEHE